MATLPAYGMLLSQMVIFFFNPDPPGAIWQDKPQIARRLARTQTVVHVGPEPYLRPLLARRTRRQTPAFRSATTCRRSRARWTLHLHLVPTRASDRRARLETALHRASPPPLAGRAARAARRTADPVAVPAGQQAFIDEFDKLDQFGPKLVIYHVVDEYSAYPTLTAEQAAQQKQLDHALTARADLVFCTARSLVEARRPINPNTHYMPNAVDYRAFQQMLADPSLQPPAGMTDLPRPILGVIGGINAKLDLTLLAELAERRPDWSLALVGPLSYGLDDGELTRLRALRNVHFLGPVPPERVPATIAACDVCLIPYRLNEQTRHVNPLKVYEYLAAGKPVVGTALPELGQFGGSVKVSGVKVSSGGWRVEGGGWGVESGGGGVMSKASSRRWRRRWRRGMILWLRRRDALWPQLTRGITGWPRCWR